MTAILALWMILTPAPCTSPLACAIEHVESRGNTWAVSPAGARGLRQVMPSVARVPALLLHVPVIGRAEGDRVLSRWLRRCRGELRCALRAYNCGNKGIVGKCGVAYAAAVEVRL